MLLILDLIFGQTWYFTRYIFSVDGKSYSGCFESNINFSGNDVSSGTIRGISSAKACANECQRNDKWDIFTYDKERNECWLKISDAGRATANGRESGRKNSPQSSIYSGDFNLIQLQKVMKHWIKCKVIEFILQNAISIIKLLKTNTIDCNIDDSLYMPAKRLRDCIKSLGGTGLSQIQYI